MTPQVSIIILSYCQAGLVKQLLILLEDILLPFTTEVIVVDNNSPTNSTIDLQTRFPKVRFIKSAQNHGYAAGNNIGIKFAIGKYILILNPDVAPTAEALIILYKFLEENSRAGLVGSQLIDADESYQHSCGRFPDWRLPLFRRTALGKTKAGQRWLDKIFMREWDHQSAQKVDWLFGAVLMAPRTPLGEGGFLNG